MKKVINQLKKVNHLISELELQIEVTKASNFYTVFSNESERESDLSKMRQELKKCLSVKYSLLDSLQLAINKEQSNISSKERALSLSMETENVS